MPEPKQHAEDRNWIEDLARYVPGFRGYLEKESRRESDELQRTWLADRLQRGKRGMEALARRLTEAGQLDQLAELERFRRRLDTLLARIRGAMQGYSGFFDLVRVNTALLDRVYEHDLALMEQVAKLGDAIEGLSGTDTTGPIDLSSIFGQLDQLGAAWDHRDDILKGLD
ncbi:MAG: hypothetical protein ACC645_23045 [Pirellulales bacterium]